MNEAWTYSVGDDDHQFDVPEVSNLFSRTTHIPGADARDFTMMAEHCGQDYHDNHDGWECTWPLVFWLYEDGKNVATVSVDMEARPHFYGRRVEP